VRESGSKLPLSKASPRVPEIYFHNPRQRLLSFTCQTENKKPTAELVPDGGLELGSYKRLALSQFLRASAQKWYMNMDSCNKLRLRRAGKNGP